VDEFVIVLEGELTLGTTLRGSYNNPRSKAGPRQMSSRRGPRGGGRVLVRKGPLAALGDGWTINGHRADCYAERKSEEQGGKGDRLGDFGDEIGERFRWILNAIPMGSSYELALSAYA
jgi:hypothetical protein